MKVAIFGSKRQKPERIERIFDMLSTHNAEIFLQRPFYNYLNSEFEFKHQINGIIEDDNFSADLAISVGGDGTFLRTAASIGKKDIPVFGINTGHLGFLADVTDDNIEEALTDILSGKYRIEDRTQLQLSTQSEKFERFDYALNEVAILKQDTASMITVHASINGEYLTSYRADGLIIATPTGSTAYSLSVGGPIMTPSASSFIIAPVASHSLNARPLVVDDTSVISLEIESRNENFLVSLDGRSEIFSTTTKLTIKKAEFTLKVVKRLEHTFYETLRDKLKWGTDPRLG